MGSRPDCFKKKEGILIVAVLFVIFLSFIGLTLLTHTISHTRIQRARLKRNTAVCQMVQELVCTLHQQREAIFNVDLNSYPVPETDYFNSDFFPDLKKSPITIISSFVHHSEENDFFKKTRIIDTINAVSETNNHQVRAAVFIDILSGNIPLNFFPLFINKKIEGSESAFLENNGITVEGPFNPVISDTAVELHVSDFLIDSLKISGEILNWENLRKKFGLEIKDEPIKKGFYFVVEDDVLESIFIQDDLQRLIFSTENGQQIIQFYIAGELYVLSYTPGQNEFFYWDNQVNKDSFFREKIIVNGNVWSLEQKNDYAFHEDASITIMVSGKTVIRTSLKAEHLDLKKMSVPRLTLITSNNNLFKSSDHSGVTVDTQEKTTIDVSIITNGAFSNQCPDLEINGHVFAKDLNNTGAVKISPQKYNSGLSDYFFTGDFKCVYNFLIDHIEEVHDVQ